MFRTRDFLLVFSIVSFLVFAIGGTLLMRYFETNAEPRAASLLFEPIENETEYEVSVSATDTLMRDERLAEMRNKIAARSELISAPKPTLEPESTVDEATTTSSPIDSIEEQRCAGYMVDTSFWDATSVTVETVEGVRVVRDVMSQDIRFTLPVRAQKSGSFCVPSDVIGVAQDGSLIRNSEVALYSVFGPDTVVGYALDGFPIHGSGSTVGTDACGGAVVAGQYGYYINTDRETILTCFAAPPSSYLGF